VGISGKLENSLGWLLTLFSGGYAQTTTAIFHSVISADAQRAMLQAAAEQSLSSVELEAFNVLMEDFRPRYGERNRLVHNLWGHSDAHPDKAIWCKSSDWAKHWAGINTAIHTQTAYTFGDISLKCVTYTVKDIDDVAKRLSSYFDRVGEFMRDLMESRGPTPIASAAQGAAPDSELPLEVHPRPQTEKE